MPVTFYLTDAIFRDSQTFYTEFIEACSLGRFNGGEEIVILSEKGTVTRLNILPQLRLERYRIDESKSNAKLYRWP